MPRRPKRQKIQNQPPVVHANQRSESFPMNQSPPSISELIASIDTGDQMQRLVALQELNQMLLFKSPQNLSQVCKSLCAALGDTFPDVILLACRCLSNLIETNEESVMYIMKHGGIKSLVSILSNVEWIDLAEQVLLVLEKTSRDYPSAVLKEDGLLAVLQYIDFFNVHTARIAIKTVANTCQTLPRLSSSNQVSAQAFDTISGVLEIIVRLSGWSDEKIVESSTVSLTRIVQWSSHSPEKMQQLLRPHLSSMASTFGALIAQSSDSFKKIISQQIKLLTVMASKSPEFANDLLVQHNILHLLEMHVYSDTKSIVRFTQMPADHITDILDLICSLLPTLPQADVWLLPSDERRDSHMQDKPNAVAIQRFEASMLPMLIDVFEAIVNLAVRIKATECVCKIVHFSEANDRPSSLKQLVRFSVSLLSQHEQALKNMSFPREKQQNLMMLLSGMCIANVLLKRYPEQQSVFARQGFIAELEALLAKADTFVMEMDQLEIPAEAIDSCSSADDSSDVGSMRRLISFISNRDSAARSFDYEITYFTKQAFSIRKCIKRIFELASDFNSNLVSTPSEERLERLVALIVPESDAESLLRNLRNLSIFLNEQNDEDAITCFEVSKSRIVSMLIDFLSSTHPEESILSHPWKLSEWKCSLDERIQLFLEAFEFGDSFKKLVNILKDVVATTERFELLGISSSNSLFDIASFSRQLGTTVHPQLSRQIRLHISCDDETVFSPLHISIQACASFNALAAFIKSRIANPSVNSLGQLDDDEDLESEEEFVIDTSAVQEDVGLSFKINGKPCIVSSTVFAAVYGCAQSDATVMAVLGQLHRLVFSKKQQDVLESAMTTPRASLKVIHTSPVFRDICTDFEPLPCAGDALFLLRLLYNISAHKSILAQDCFLHSKLAAKVNRQFDEPLIVLSDLLPRWCTELVQKYPFLFPFRTRLQFFKLTSFGYARSIGEFQPQRIPKAKVKINRQDVLAELPAVFASNRHSLLEIEYLNEVGTGSGPTLEFFAIVSAAFCAKSELWRLQSQDLYPAPLKNAADTLETFSLMGSFVGKALMDQRTVDMKFSDVFLQQLFFETKPDLALLERLDPEFAHSLKQLDNCDVSSLNLDFTLPGSDDELCTDGADKAVTNDNVKEYVELVVQHLLGTGVEQQIEAFRSGFKKYVSVQHFASFSSEEILLLICGREEYWNHECIFADVVLEQYCKADHGYQTTSRIIKDLFDVLVEFTYEEKRAFLKFTTGSPRLPIGGLKKLDPPLTIVRKPHPEPDTCLPSVMTCANYLKVPEYSSKEILHERFLTAMYECDSFHLS